MPNNSYETVNDAVVRDAKFLAALDSMDYEGAKPVMEYLPERRTYWEGRLQKPEDGERVLIARIGGLYVGYVALQTQCQHATPEIVIPRRYQGEGVIEELLSLAGVSVENIGQTQSLQPVLVRV